MTTLAPLLAAGSLLCLALACRAHVRERERRARAQQWVERFRSEMERGAPQVPPDAPYNCRCTLVPAIPRDDDPEAPTMSEPYCQRIGHAWITGKARPWKSCPRCGAFERLMDYRDFDARR